MFILVRDDYQDRITMYCSGSQKLGDHFTMEKAIDCANTYSGYQRKVIKVFTDDDYSALDTKEYYQKHQRKVREM